MKTLVNPENMFRDTKKGSSVNYVRGVKLGATVISNLVEHGRIHRRILLPAQKPKSIIVTPKSIEEISDEDFFRIIQKGRSKEVPELDPNKAVNQGFLDVFAVESLDQLSESDVLRRLGQTPVLERVWISDLQPCELKQFGEIFELSVGVNFTPVTSETV